VVASWPGLCGRDQMIAALRLPEAGHASSDRLVASVRRNCDDRSLDRARGVVPPGRRSLSLGELRVFRRGGCRAGEGAGLGDHLGDPWVTTSGGADPLEALQCLPEVGLGRSGAAGGRGAVVAAGLGAGLLRGDADLALSAPGPADAIPRPGRGHRGAARSLAARVRHTIVL
jgi:hypothetical protein